MKTGQYVASTTASNEPSSDISKLLEGDAEEGAVDIFDPLGGPKAAQTTAEVTVGSD